MSPPAAWQLRPFPPLTQGQAYPISTLALSRSLSHPPPSPLSSFGGQRWDTLVRRGERHRRRSPRSLPPLPLRRQDLRLRNRRWCGWKGGGVYGCRSIYDEGGDPTSRSKAVESHSTLWRLSRARSNDSSNLWPIWWQKKATSGGERREDRSWVAGSLAWVAMAMNCWRERG